MSRNALLLTMALAALLPFVPLCYADDGEQGRMCKDGWYMCWCKHTERGRNMCESDDVFKKCQRCWGDIAQFQCLKGTKKEVMEKACAEAKKADKLVLYIGNTGG